MNSKVIVALDYETEAQALSLVDQIDPSLCRLKVGKELFTHEGSSIVKALHDPPSRSTCPKCSFFFIFSEP